MEEKESPPPEDDRKKPEEGNDGDGKEEQDKGFHVSKTAIVIVVLVVLALAAGGVLYWLHARNFVETDDAYTTGHVHQIGSRVAGTVEFVPVDDNQLVKQGDVLVRLDPSSYQVDLKRAEAGEQQARAQVTQAEATIVQARAEQAGSAAQVGQARAQVTQAEAQLRRARSDFDRVSGLYSKDIKAVSKADVDSTTEALKAAQSGAEGARANLDSAQAQVQAADANIKVGEANAEAGRANVSTAQAQVQDARLQLSYCEVRAPVDGKISRKTVETGQRLSPGQALMSVVPQDVWVVANLKETQLARVRKGQRVDVEIDAIPDHTFFATVDSIQEGSGATFSLLPTDNATGNFTKIVQRVPVKIVFDPESVRDFHDRIVPGLSVIPKIDLESLRDHKREPERMEIEKKQNREAEAGR